MKKKIMTMLIVGMIAIMNVMPVMATEETIEEITEETTEETTEAAEEVAGIVIPKGNMVDVEVIDLSLHEEKTGDFTAVYAYENPFKGTDTSKGVVLEFYVKPTWEVHELGTIFAFMGSGAYDGRLYFTPGSYLGYNSPGFGGYYDANLYNYLLVTDYIRDGALMRIELTPDGFAVYADDKLCYDQSILSNPEAGAGDYKEDSDFTPVLTWLSGAEAMYFGYGSWWNAASANEANAELSQVSFRLADGTVVYDKLQADKDLVEKLGGSVEAKAEAASTEIHLADVEVELFDIDSVEYEGISTLPIMAVAVGITALIAIVLIVIVCKPRVYDEV